MDDIAHLPFLYPLVFVVMAGDWWIDQFDDAGPLARAFCILILFALGIPGVLLAGALAIPLLLMTPFWWMVLAAASGSRR